MNLISVGGHGGQRAAYSSQFSPFTMWDPGVNRRSSGLVPNALSPSPLFVCFGGSVLLTLFLRQAGTHYVVQACLKLMVILLLQLPTYQDCRGEPPCWPSSCS